MGLVHPSGYRLAGASLCACMTILFLLALAKFSQAAEPADALWMTDYKQALAQAAKEKRNLLLDFTGSDWCPYCIQMDKEVLSRPEFEEFAKKNLVLVKLDFPRKKQLPPAETAQNRKLGQQFAIEGYPTYVLVNAEGKEVKRQVGYLEGGPKEFIKWARVGS
jgi:protein disulfide-isomerase